MSNKPESQQTFQMVVSMCVCCCCLLLKIHVSYAFCDANVFCTSAYTLFDLTLCFSIAMAYLCCNSSLVLLEWQWYLVMLAHWILWSIKSALLCYIMQPILLHFMLPNLGCLKWFRLSLKYGYSIA